MFARLLSLTLVYQSAARNAGLNKRTTISVNAEEWEQLCADPQFAQIHDGKDFTVFNDVVIRKATNL
jgi:hypothetical protein